MPSLSGPVHLRYSFPLPQPEPAAGCDVCGALAKQRAAARAAGNESKVIDCSIEMRVHPHPKAAR
ncbi:hypothetical protein O1M07_01790 [Streptomyces albulus]|nr:hypothetical protein [Streptomyces noursei]GGX43109.1 hypothetical protein GCM10010341_76380 [Streptomyces noursei]